MKINSKPINFFATTAVNEENSETISMLILACYRILQKHFVDMLVIEKNDNKIKIRSAGYFFIDEYVLDEKTILGEFSINITRKIWLKVDDYGNQYIATFVYPEER